MIEIVIDRARSTGSVNLVGVDGDAARRRRSRRGAAQRAPHPDLAPHAQLPDDTRLWAALQRASGGTWAGCVYDVDRIVEALDARTIAAVLTRRDGKTSNETVSNDERRRSSRATARFIALARRLGRADQSRRSARLPASFALRGPSARATSERDSRADRPAGSVGRGRDVLSQSHGAASRNRRPPAAEASTIASMTRRAPGAVLQGGAVARPRAGDDGARSPRCASGACRSRRSRCASTRARTIVGYTIGNDMSSRDIEGENPLYLPQAKIYDGSCALGPAVLVTDEPLPPDDDDRRLVIVAATSAVVRGRDDVLADATDAERAGRVPLSRNELPERLRVAHGHRHRSAGRIHAAGGRRDHDHVPAIGTLRNTVAA